MHGGLTYFSASDDTHGYEPWVSDGTEAGTRLLADLVPTGGSDPSFLAAVESQVFFAAGSALYVTDGSTAGTRLVRSFLDIGLVPDRAQAVPFGGGILFVAGRFSDCELWFSDGTAGGTRLVRDTAGGRPLNPRELVLFAGRVFFRGTDGTYGTELFMSDGTTAGTVIASDVRPGSGSSSPSQLRAIGDRLFFVATHGTSGTELWSSRGVPGDAALVLDIHPGTGSSEPHELTAVEDRLFFVAHDADSGGTGDELYVSDGTTAGTRLVRDIYPGWVDGCGGSLFSCGGTRRVLFAGRSVTGLEPWISDGTAAGTVQLADVEPGAGDSRPADHAVIGDRLLFMASSSASGREPHAFDLRTLELGGVTAFGQGCAGTGGLVPRIGGHGVPAIGAPEFGVSLAEALPGANCGLLIQDTVVPIALGTCTVYPRLPAILIVAVCSAAGTADLAFAVPDDPTLVGDVLYFQWMVLDPEGSWERRLAFSGGLELRIGR